MVYVCDVLYAVLYVCVSCFVVRTCAVSRYMDVFYCDMFNYVNVYLGYWKFCLVCINGRRYVCCAECLLSLMSVMSPYPALCHLSLRIVVKLCILGVLALGVSLVSCIVMISACVS